MALIEINKRSHTGGKGVSADYYVAISAHRTGEPAKDVTQVAIYISAAAMRNLRWVAGDRVKILMDTDSNEMHVRRAASTDVKGFALSPLNGIAATESGKPVATSFRTTDRQIPRVSGRVLLSTDDCYIADNGDLVFVYPLPFNLPKTPRNAVANNVEPWRTAAPIAHVR